MRNLCCYNNLHNTVSKLLDIYKCDVIQCMSFTIPMQLKACMRSNVALPNLNHESVLNHEMKRATLTLSGNLPRKHMNNRSLVQIGQACLMSSFSQLYCLISFIECTGFKGS